MRTNLERLLLLLYLSSFGVEGNRYELREEKIVFGALSCDDYEVNAAHQPQQCNCDTQLDVAFVRIEAGHSSGKDLLACAACPASVTASYDDLRGVLTLSGPASIQNFADAINAVTFTTTDTGGTPKSIVYNYGNALFSSRTGLFSRFFDEKATWSEAAAACSDSSNAFLTSTGNLATVPSRADQRELAFISNGSDAWLGGSDSAEEGSWKWGASPFYKEGATQGNQPLTTQSVPWYTNWATGEPSAAGKYLYMAPERGGAWIAGRATENRGYVCQWGSTTGICLADYDAASSVTLFAGCAGYSSAGSCESLVQGNCEWNPDLDPPCVPKVCQRQTEELQCNSDIRCHWEVANDGVTGLCRMRRCSSLHSRRSTCSLDGNCYWEMDVELPGTNGQTADICTDVHCPRVTDRCECTKFKQCSWDIDAGVCEDIKNAACPSADIAFLLDATVSMSKRFRSHPVGFYGVIEQLRDWIADMTLSADPAAHGFRVGFISFGKEDEAAFNPDPFEVKGTPVEVQKDLDWHGNRFDPKWSKHATAVARALLGLNWHNQAADAGRRRIIMIITDEKLTDPDTQLGGLKSRLTQANVEIFGVILRGGEADTSSSAGAEAKLRKLVSSPDKHLLGVPLEKLKTSVLDTICDPASIFGSSIADPAIPTCPTLQDDVTCMERTDCIWDYAGQSCTLSTCSGHCNLDICASYDGCVWDSQKSNCLRRPIESCDGYQSAAMCAQADCCTWADGVCREACCSQTAADSCRAFGVKNPKCRPSTPPVDGECQANICEWKDTSQSSKCLQKKCAYFEEEECKDPACEWDSNKNECKERPCAATTFATCTADLRCQWNTFVTPSCQLRYCSKYTTEGNCNADPICQMDATRSPLLCRRLSCGYATTEQSCDSPDCIWIPNTGGTLPTTDAYPAAPGYCKKRTCQDYTSVCECQEDQRCVWHVDHCVAPGYEQCPNLDVLFLLDGSGSMQQSFGIHPHGYYALMEMLKDWMLNVPLSGDKAGEQPANPGNGGFRITFIQFSYDNDIRKATVPGGTGGRLSGDADELVTDVHYHEANYMAGTTMILPALRESEEVFKDSPPGRHKVMVIICDGRIKDDMNVLKDEVRKIVNEGVTIFGIVIRRFLKSNAIDKEAAYMLRPLVSSPHDDYLLNIPLDDIPDSVLNHFCDPNSKLGRAVAPPLDVKHFPCAVWGYPDECNADPFCEWQQPALSERHCTRAAACPTLNCQSVPVHFADLWTCDNCRPQRGMVKCGAQYAPAHTTSGTCAKSHCSAYCDRGDCEKIELCEWNGAAGVCTRKVCAYQNEGACEQDPESLCKWEASTAKCTLKPCRSTFIKEQCEAKQPGCKWDESTEPPICKEVIVCGPMKQQECDSSFQCTWDPLKNQCKDSRCPWTTEGTCTLDRNCKWDRRKCRDDFCREYADKASCTDPRCYFSDDSGFCEEKPCEPIAVEAECTYKAPVCTWDVGASPPCKTEYCGNFVDERLCGEDPRCVWGDKGCIYTPCQAEYQRDPATCKGECKLVNEDGGYCKSNRCVDLTQKCDCLENENCFWKVDGANQPSCVLKNFVKCPDLDVVFILDGSGSMKAQFGHHPHGFYAMMEMLKDWLKTLPLTGDKAGSPSTATGGTFRLAFIQFSGANRKRSDAKVADCAGCTQGRFSGDLTELSKDVDWHHSNYYMKGTMIELALKMAVDIFEHPNPRTNVLIVMTDGELYDPKKVPKHRQHLDAKDVTTFGVVMRKGIQHTQADIRAQATLLPIVSEPKDQHFLNIPLDDIPSALLNDFCDPNSLFGATIQQHAGVAPPAEVSCGKWSPGECLLDSKCSWQSTTATTCDDPRNCLNLNCEPRADKLARQYRCSECKLVGGELRCDASFDDKPQRGFCKRSGCLCRDSQTCTADPQCELSKAGDCVQKLCDHNSETECTKGINVLACSWDGGKCTIKKCPHMTEAQCRMDPKCFWDVTEPLPLCKPVLDCTVHQSEKECHGDPSGKCYFDAAFGQGCVKNPCLYQSQAACDADKKCKWDVGAAKPAVGSTAPCLPQICPQYTKEENCKRDPLCRWDANRCVGNECAGKAELSCRETPHCAWNAGRNGCDLEYCWAQYGTGKQAMCNADDRCIHVNNECVTKTCGKIKKACDCREEPSCTWDAKRNVCTAAGYRACPPLDLTIIIDGSGSMSNTFGRHPSGYEALLAVLSDWIHALPLTGENADVGVNSQGEGFRIALIQFSGSSNPGTVHIDPVTAGRLTGSIAEVESALSWHKDNPIYSRTFIQHALETAVETFRASPKNRVDVLLVFTDGKLNDPEVLRKVKDDLQQEGVKTFGIVIRRFAVKQPIDLAAEDTIKQVVSDNIGDHFLNLQVDEIAGSALTTFCDATGAFGSLIVQSIEAQRQDCPAISDPSACRNNAQCDFSDTTGRCTKTSCDKHCTSATCEAAGCKWDGVLQACLRQACSLWDQGPDCNNDKRCEWKGALDPPCREKETCRQKAEAACKTGPECVWQPGFKTAQAVRAFPDASCKVIASTCTCTTVVNGASVSIDSNFQNGQDVLSCPGCGAKGISAVFSPETGILTLSGQATIEEYASALSSVEFTSSSSSSSPRSVSYNYGRAFFSRETLGYYRWVQDAKSWKDAQESCASDANKVLGLTGHLATVSSKAEAEVLKRLAGNGWIGASDEGEQGAWRWVVGAEGCPPAAGCASGSTKGKAFYSTAAGILPQSFADWQHGAPAASGRAEMTRSGWRDRSATDQLPYFCEWSGIGSLCAFSTVLTGTTVLLPGSGACTAAPPPLPVLTPAPVPRTPVPQPPLSPVPPVPSKCQPFDKNICLDYPGCIWDSAEAACKEGSCSSVKANVDCNALPDCYWRPSSGSEAVDPSKCLPAVDRCSDIDRGDVCSGYPLCEATAQDPCSIIRPLDCVWVTARGGVGTCVDRPCGYANRDACVKDTNCGWNTDADKCVIDPCTSKTSSETCLVDKKTSSPTICAWDDDKSPRCDLNVCAKHPDAAACGQDEQKRCEWITAGNTAFCTTTRCFQHGTNREACEAHPGYLCMIDASTQTCVYRTCASYTADGQADPSAAMCACRTDPRCSWDGTASECREQRFAGCPDLDLALLIDGSGSMKKSFGRHPQGFFALLEMLRTWFRALPLTGESHTVGLASMARNGGFRVALVQFSPPDVVHVDDVTGGQLTGSLDEMEQALTWHEANPLFKTTYIDKGLDKAASAFRNSPPHRKKVLLIFTDGRIKDVDILGPEKAKLQAEGVKTFGIVIRRQAIHTRDDLEAADALAEVVSAPREEHQLNLEMDEVSTGVLLTFCEATGPFGKLLVSASSAACAAHAEETCEKRGLCQWNGFVTACQDHPCTAHCSRTKCTAASQCAWKDDKAECVADRCGVWTEQQDCDARRPRCVWDSAQDECTEAAGCMLYTKQSTCQQDQGCQWNSGYLPQEPFSPFPEVDCKRITSDDAACDLELRGAAVAVEDGFSPAHDVLLCPACVKLGVVATWDAGRGVLLMEPPKQGGKLPLSTFAAAVASVTFTTTDDSGASKRITYNYGHAVFSSATGQYYRFFPQDGVTWQQAQSLCSRDDNTILGLQGYLATVSSPEEQFAVASRVGGEGWVGAVSPEAEEGVWRWVAGPEGCPPAAVCPPGGGGRVFHTAAGTAAGQYANWRAGEPDAVDPAEDFVLLHPDGTWGNAPAAHPGVPGYTCEWGGIGAGSINPFESRGVKTFVRATDTKWGTCTEAPLCPGHPDIHTCRTDDRCRWLDPGKCVPKDFCALLTVEGALVCGGEAACQWDTTGQRCIDVVGCPHHVSDVACEEDLAVLCQWDYETARCRPATGCAAQPTDEACNGYTGDECVWHVAYLPGTAANPFNATSSGCSSSTIDSATVMVELGYREGSDLLTCTACSAPGSAISATFRPRAGVLVLTGSATAVEYLAALRSVTFYTSSNDMEDRRVTYSLGGSAVYSPLTERQYQWHPDKVTWTAAKDACEADGKGYLATAGSWEEQAVLERMGSGGTAWIGAEDAALDGTWKWATGPEKGAEVERGYWEASRGEPMHGKRYAAISGGTGGWRALDADAPTDGYTCARNEKPACFASVLLRSGEGGRCTPDTRDGCLSHLSEFLCTTRGGAQCRWDADTTSCRDKPTDCCSDAEHGACTRLGCCVCKPGWHGCDSDSGASATCHLYSSPASECAWCHPQLKCSGNGVCAPDGSCICAGGWTGATCSIPSCAPVGPHVHTAHPNTPVKGQPFTVVVQGCGLRGSDLLRFVPRGAACSAALPDRTGPCWVRGEPMILGTSSSCPEGSVSESPAVSGMELVVSAQASWDTPDAFTEYSLCHSSDNGTTWAHVKTHAHDGSDAQYQRVCASYYSCPGAGFRAAAGPDDQCGCGFWCWLALVLCILSLLLLLLLLYLLYRVFNPPRSKQQDYEDFSMEQMQKETMKKPIVNEDSLSQVDDRYEV